MNSTRKTTAPTLLQMDEAMEWVQRLSDDSNPSEKDITDWLLWYESAPGNQQAFDELQRFWTQLGEFGERSEFAARPDTEGEGTYTGAIRVRAAWTRDVDERNSRWKRACRPLLFGSLAAVALVVVFLGSLYFRHGPELTRKLTPGRPAAESADLPVRHTRLPDGSSVDLAARASLAVEYTVAQRALELTSGEAFFSVAPNRSRPFVVKTSTVRVLAVGTKFNVRKESDRVIVTVVEGVVAVSAAPAESLSAADERATPPITLNAGNEVTWFTGTGKRVVRAMAPDRALAWREGRLDYVNETLATVVADLNRYSNTRVIIRDPRLEQMTYTGTVFIQSLDEWLQAMPSEFPIKVVRENAQVALEPLARQHPADGE